MVTVDDQHGYDEAVVHAAAEANWQTVPPQALLTTLARLRAFAILLCMNVDLAEHLVAITLLRAGVVMKPSSIGLNLAAWLLGRLRQYYYREHATARTSAASRPSATWKSRHAQHQDTLAALAELTAEQREALVLVDAAGCSAREAAHICRCTPIQFRNRLTGARDRLARLLSAPSSRPCNAVSLSLALLALSGSRGVAIDRHHS